MRATELELPGVIVIEPTVFRDERGQFMEAWSRRRYRDLGLPSDFVQDNVSHSVRNVVRGLHYQHPHGQGKLVSVLRGEIWDVAVDIRAGSPTFGLWVGHALSADNALQLYIPEGYAHGFAVSSADAVVSYKCTDYYDAAAEGTLLWNDADIGIEWPVEAPIVSEKDRAGLRLHEIGEDRLPRFGPA